MTDWNAVSAVSSSVAAIAALVATGLAAWLAREEHADRRRNKVESYYDRWVIDPARDAIENFIQNSGPLFTEYAQKRLKPSQSSEEQIVECLASAMDSFNTHFFRLKSSLSLRLRALKDEELTDTVNGELGALQDAVSFALDRYAAEPEALDFGSLLDHHGATLLRSILDHVEKKIEAA
ncbi:MAG: hypothetical protein H0T48_11710 [Gemmatimonadaceae bacterium]|nr:hypothetical protein [Gemmatimonadaceae bacterium]